MDIVALFIAGFFRCKVIKTNCWQNVSNNFRKVNPRLCRWFTLRKLYNKQIDNFTHGIYKENTLYIVQNYNLLNNQTVAEHEEEHV